MNYKRIFTGSSETEEQLRLFVNNAKSLDDGISRDLFKDDYMWKVMTIGRNGPNDRYAGSMALDDTGGFFELFDGIVFLTEKAKSCIRI
jgi:hypothetical protein